MNRNRSISFLKKYNKFTNSEKSDFLKLANSGLFFRKRDYSGILKTLASDSETILKTKKIKDQTKWNRCSELNKIADKFLLIKSLERNKLNESVLLSEEFLNRGLNSLFNLKFKDLIAEYSEKQILDFDYNMLYSILNNNIDYIKTEKALKKYGKNVDEISRRRMKLLLLELLQEMLNVRILRYNGSIIPETFTEVFFKSMNMSQILSFMNNDSDKKEKIINNLIELTYLLFLCMNGINEKQNLEYFDKAKNIFFNNLKSISKEYRFRFYYFLIVYSLKLINSGDENGNREYLYLINKKLKEGLLRDFNNEYFFINNVRDIVIIALSLKKFSWVKNFIENYSKYIPVALRKDNINLFNARLNFEMKNYSVCIEFLNKINTRQTVFYVDVIIIRLKTLFELKEYENCYIELRKLNEFLKKKRRIPDLFMTYAKGFCKAFNMLILLTENPDKKNFDKTEYKFVQFVSSGKNLIGKKWLIQKFENIARPR